jgi:hypothetical protein
MRRVLLKNHLHEQHFDCHVGCLHKILFLLNSYMTDPFADVSICGKSCSKTDSMRSSGLRRKLDPALKSWMDNVIIPALVRENLAEIEKRNRLAPIGVSEVTSDKDGDEP